MNIKRKSRLDFQSCSIVWARLKALNAKFNKIKSHDPSVLVLLDAFYSRYFQKIKAELDSMMSRGVIRRLDTNEVSEWCASIVVVPKSNGNVRICTDFTKLNL